MRELRNLIESMVVLAPGAVIRAEDIPSEIRAGGGRGLVPARAETITFPVLPAADASQLPQMEFIFRTLVELKLDVEDLRREFDRYKREHPELVELAARTVPDLRAIAVPEPASGFEDLGREIEAEPEEPAIAFHAGMTMAELEREAIVATLKEVGGNRRKAAEKLQIGERTLYRKLKEYEIEL